MGNFPNIVVPGDVGSRPTPAQRVAVRSLREAAGAGPGVPADGRRRPTDTEG
jgi:hypothetical protein